MSRGFRIFLAVFGIAGVTLFLLSMSLLAPFEALVALAVGWVTWPIAVLPQVQVSWPAIAGGAVSVLLLVVVAHVTARAILARRGVAWRVRQTGIAVGGMALMFTIAMASAGIAHQAAWLSAEPIVEQKRRKLNVRCTFLEAPEFALRAGFTMVVLPEHTALLDVERSRGVVCAPREDGGWQQLHEFLEGDFEQEMANLKAGQPAFSPPPPPTPDAPPRAE